MEPTAFDAAPHPRFSVLMAAFQAEATVARAVRSVLAQTREDWELIVVDDGSADATAERAREAAAGDPRVSILVQENRGAAAARNLAAGHARGEWLCVLDSDDEYEPTYLERMDALATSAPAATLLSCNGTLVAPDGSRAAWLESGRFEREQSFSLLQLIRANDVFVMSTVRADAFRAVGGFDAGLAAAEDYDLWLRLLSAGAVHRYTPERLGVYYRSAGSVSSDQSGEALATVRILTRLLETGRLTAREARAARRRIRSVRGRAELERRRLEQDFEISRRGALLTAAAFGTPSRRFVARALALISPRRYIRLAALRRDGQVSELYRSAGEQANDR